MMIEKVYKLIISQYYGEKLLCFNYIFSYRILYIIYYQMLCYILIKLYLPFCEKLFVKNIDISRKS